MERLIIGKIHLMQRSKFLLMQDAPADLTS